MQCLRFVNGKKCSVNTVGASLSAVSCVVAFIAFIAEINSEGWQYRGKVWLDAPIERQVPFRDPKVVFVVVQTRPSPGWCRMLMTAVVTNVSVISIGMGGNYSHTIRANWLLNFLDDEGLHDDDVLVMFDGADTFFTDEINRKEMLDPFIKMSPPLPKFFNQTAIYRGDAWPPMLHMAEPDCYAPQLNITYNPQNESHWDRCARFYAMGLSEAKTFGAERLLGLPPPVRGHLNSGGIVGRVWAYKEAFNVYLKFRETSSKWWCDQTMWTILFIWSAGNATGVDPKYIIRRGIISLDYDKRYFYYPTAAYNTRAMIGHFTGNPHQWLRYLPKYFTRLPWYRNLAGNSTYRQSVVEALRNTTVITYKYTREKVLKSYEDVCNVEEMTDPDFVVDPLDK
uniref:Expression site-associated gene (ESAG) protein, putative expression site-associated gene 3 (ESAG3) protein, putative n=1 Tax=Trypanosoma brucei brucei (strain 927/4 GUTat10.1) TaxID=185431 RepID=Q4FKU9_TRYB2|nr:expression site-associated gene (ESAG) protein, putative; expression site-associated gene 3 (ESAG3) protein, putative [Trypanosoma brucei brucei TREU927]